jgi:hypothetical protein
MYKENSLLNLRQGLDRYFKDNDKRFDIISDSAFDMNNKKKIATNNKEINLVFTLL